MKRIKDLIDRIDEEICDAKHYAEEYVWSKNKGDGRSAQFKTMSQDELNHGMILHQFAVDEIEQLKNGFDVPSKMMETWEKAHSSYVEKSAWIKQMLTM